MTATFGCKQKEEKIGVLIAQLGTPESPTKKGLKPYLRQFLGDRRVIEVNRLLWFFVLNFIILPFRPAKSARLYKRIWTEEGSPLLLITKSQAEGVQERLSAISDSVVVEFGMRYGKPSIEEAVDRLIDEHHCSKILLFSMYPQYSGSTTASNYDAFFKHILRRRVVPTVRVAQPYYRDTRYISALAAIINESLAQAAFEPEVLFLSYHGIPVSYRDKGDTYCCHTLETTAALKEALHVEPDTVQHVFQSRFGKEPWLTPYTDETVIQCTKSGMRKMAIACPGFTTDCLETLDEMGTEIREEFEAAGGEDFLLIPCLNDSTVWLDAMAAIIQDELGSWLDEHEQMRGQKICCPVGEEVELPCCCSGKKIAI